MFPHMLAHHHTAQWLILPPFISVAYSVFGWWGGTFVSFCYSHTHTHTQIPTCTTLWALRKECGKSLLHFILSWENLPDSEKARLSVYKMLMWVAGAWLCAEEHHRGPLVAVKATCSVCFSMCEMMRRATVLQTEFRQRKASALLQRTYLLSESTKCPFPFLLFHRESQKQQTNESSLHSLTTDGKCILLVFQLINYSSH